VLSNLAFNLLYIEILAFTVLRPPFFFAQFIRTNRNILNLGNTTAVLPLLLRSEDQQQQQQQTTSNFIKRMPGAPDWLD
jgi:hypothetical protein